MQPITRITPGAGTVVVGTGTGGCVGGKDGGIGGLVTTGAGSVVATVMAGRVTGGLVVTGTAAVVFNGTTIVGIGEEVISGLILWISRLPGGSTGVIVLPGRL